MVAMDHPLPTRPPLDNDAPRAPFVILAPAVQTTPLVFASPHSGCRYPDEFLAASRLDATALRRSEDSFVDELFAGAPAHGAPLIAATFPPRLLRPQPGDVGT